MTYDIDYNFHFHKFVSAHRTKLFIRNGNMDRVHVKPNQYTRRFAAFGRPYDTSLSGAQ